MYETHTMNSDLKGQVQTSGYMQQVFPKNENVCPHCGRCPHCGQPTPAPTYPYYPITTTVPYTLTGGGIQSQQGGISGTITGTTSFNSPQQQIGHGG